MRVRGADFTDGDSLRAAFEGAEQVLIVSSNARATGGDTLAQHRSAIGQAKAAGARRIVYTSHMGAGSRSAFAPMHDHAATEAMLGEAGMKWTSLRNGFYASTVPQLIGDAAGSGVLAAPRDGKVSWTAHADLAAAAALVLVGAGRFEGPPPPLPAGAALDLAAGAALVSDVSGRPVERRVVSDADHEKRLAEAEMNPKAIETIMGLFRASRAGEFATVDPTLAELLERPTTSLRARLSAARLDR